MILYGTGTEHGILPVGTTTKNTWVGELRAGCEAKQRRNFILVLCKFTQVHQVQFFLNDLVTRIHFIIDLAFTGFTFFGSNQDHAIRGLRSIDRLGRGIFQDIDGLNIIRVDSSKETVSGLSVRPAQSGITRTEFCITGKDHSIHHDQGVIGIDGSHPTNAE